MNKINPKDRTHYDPNHRSWDSEWAERQNVPEWPMWTLIFCIAFVLFVFMRFLGFETF